MFIKGYKIDRVKLEQNFDSRPDDPQNTRFLPLWKHFPHPFKYLATIKEENGDITLVVVLEDGHNRECLEEKEVPLLGGSYEKVFTLGVWITLARRRITELITPPGGRVGPLCLAPHDFSYRVPPSPHESQSPSLTAEVRSCSSLSQLLGTAVLDIDMRFLATGTPPLVALPPSLPPEPLGTALSTKK
ncbi:hypothetical protein EDB85DRAFT_2138116 [Lactarius pseudohatsudake]|nr:hypothetical protein EDB85DRAFT_2138116 [Lactarius pseudohatsudake]